MPGVSQTSVFLMSQVSTSLSRSFSILIFLSLNPSFGNDEGIPKGNSTLRYLPYQPVITLQFPPFRAMLSPGLGGNTDELSKRMTCYQRGIPNITRTECFTVSGSKFPAEMGD